MPDQLALKQAHKWGIVIKTWRRSLTRHARRLQSADFWPAQAHKLLDTLKSERLGSVHGCAVTRLAVVRLWSCAGKILTSTGVRCGCVRRSPVSVAR